MEKNINTQSCVAVFKIKAMNVKVERSKFRNAHPKYKVEISYGIDRHFSLPHLTRKELDKIIEAIDGIEEILNEEK